MNRYKIVLLGAGVLAVVFAGVIGFSAFQMATKPELVQIELDHSQDALANEPISDPILVEAPDEEEDFTISQQDQQKLNELQEKVALWQQLKGMSLEEMNDEQKAMLLTMPEDQLSEEQKRYVDTVLKPDEQITGSNEQSSNYNDQTIYGEQRNSTQEPVDTFISQEMVGQVDSSYGMVTKVEDDWFELAVQNGVGKVHCHVSNPDLMNQISLAQVVRVEGVITSVNEDNLGWNVEVANVYPG